MAPYVVSNLASGSGEGYTGLRDFILTPGLMVNNLRSTVAEKNGIMMVLQPLNIIALEK
jgi:hypothetical protein